MSMLKRAIRGFAAGGAATIAMTGEFWAARRVGFIDEMPPHKAIRSVAPEIHEPQLSVTSAVAHLVIGGGAGALYGVVVPQRAQGGVTGTLFGLAVWFVGYEAVMPAATDIAPAHQDRRQRAATILVAHVVYGALLGLLVSRRSD
jgi:hypothetical protein